MVCSSPLAQCGVWGTILNAAFCNTTTLINCLWRLSWSYCQRQLKNKIQNTGTRVNMNKFSCPTISPDVLLSLADVPPTISASRGGWSRISNKGFTTLC